MYALPGTLSLSLSQARGAIAAHAASAAATLTHLPPHGHVCRDREPALNRGQGIQFQRPIV